MGNIFSASKPKKESKEISNGKVYSNDQVTIDAFRPLVHFGFSHFGNICLAERKFDGRIVEIRYTLKYKALRDDFIEFILNERKIWKTLQSPFICQLRYAIQNEYYIYLIRDFMEGGNMQIQSIEKKWTENELGPILAEMICAITYLHQNNIVYRDFRPKNILLDTLGHAYLGEFGLAVKKQPGKPIFGQVGVNGYLAPEMFKADGYDEAVDYWAIGVSFYELFFKDRPFTYQSNNKELSFVDWIKCSDDFKSLLSGLLNVDPLQRLGNKPNMPSVKEHKFFQFTSWELVDVKLTKPNFIPRKARQIINSENFGVPEIGNGLGHINHNTKKHLFNEYEYYENAVMASSFPGSMEDGPIMSFLIFGDTGEKESTTTAEQERSVASDIRSFTFDAPTAKKRGYSNSMSSMVVLKTPRGSLASMAGLYTRGREASMASNMNYRPRRDRYPSPHIKEEHSEDDEEEHERRVDKSSMRRSSDEGDIAETVSLIENIPQKEAAAMETSASDPKLDTIGKEAKAAIRRASKIRHDSVN